MLQLHRAYVAFAEGDDGGEPQCITFQNTSSSSNITFKIEANCSARYKVVPITGLLPPGSSEQVLFSLRQGEVPKPSEDRFLIRAAPYEPEFDSPRDFWAKKKKLPEFTCEKQIIQVVGHDGQQQQQQTVEEDDEAENATAVDDTHVQERQEPSEYVQSIQAMAKRAESEGNFALAAAWYEFMLPHIPSVQQDVDRNVSRSEEFDLLVARDEVYKLQSQRQDMESSFLRESSSPPPQQRRMQQQKANSSGLSASSTMPHFAAPTKTSLAMRHQRRASGPITPPPLAKTPPVAAASSKRAHSSNQQQQQPKLKTPTTAAAQKYIIDVYPMFSTAGSTRIILPTPELTVREMKDLVLHTLRLNREYEDLDLFVKDLILSDHWRGTDFGLRPGITRLQMKRKRRSPTKRPTTQPPRTPLATATVVAEEEEEEEADEHFAQWEAKYSELAQSLMEMTLERDMLLKQLDQMGNEYDVLAGKVLKLGRDNDQLEVEKMELTRRLFLYENRAPACASPTPRSGLPPQLSYHCFCAVAAPLLFVDRESEDVLGNPVRIGNQVFQFDAVLAQATPQSIAEQLPESWFEAVLYDKLDRTLVLVGETLSAKSLLLEGFASPTHRRGIYLELCSRLFNSIAAMELYDEQVHVALSAFQTFQDGRVIDFSQQVSTTSPQIAVRSVQECERILMSMLRGKEMDVGAAQVIREGQPTSSDSCIVFTLEIVNNSCEVLSSLRVIESCGIETGEEALVGHIVRGEATVCCVLHPALQERTSVLACATALDIANRFRG